MIVLTVLKWIGIVILILLLVLILFLLLLLFVPIRYRVDFYADEVKELEEQNDAVDSDSKKRDLFDELAELEEDTTKREMELYVNVSWLLKFLRVYLELWDGELYYDAHLALFKIMDSEEELIEEDEDDGEGEANNQ